MTGMYPITAARMPKPVPASNTVRTRPRGVCGAMSPSPNVKKVVPLKYKLARKLIDAPEPGLALATAQFRSAYPNISPSAHRLSKPRSDRGPYKLANDSRRFRVLINLVTARHGGQVDR